MSDEKKPDQQSTGQSSIRRSTSSRSSGRSRKKKKNQLPIGIAVLAVVVLIAILLGMKNELLAFFWITGIAFGYILQRARFCFTAAMRDPMLTGGTSLTKAVLIAFAFTSIGFIAIKYGAFARGLPIPGQGYVVPVSFATVVGSFMFGIGMVIAGGCASGTLMRVGEGFLMQVLSLFFFVIGSLWGAHDFGWWKLHVIMKGKAIFLPDLFGWIGAVIIQLLVIVLLWIAADKWEKHKNA
ncbi:YeeE/YedE thiosulfate transporter family protein [Sediminispirochaeta bajacaliforniensis]|uniref:YeeE/YedE thiosulfate transporter family protein n=1 Tax=Sediminispirochaeta bajacaliforniensis TaxID=148 RepID=UPI00037E0BF8|nr:YeeE/YedE thiosulfate transporter family protein [Sediminispirochaeta bajacaliforniensis]